MKKKEMPVAGRPRCPVVPPRRRGSARPRERGGGHTQGETDPRGGGAKEAPADHGSRSARRRRSALPTPGSPPLLREDKQREKPQAVGLLVLLRPKPHQELSFLSLLCRFLSPPDRRSRGGDAMEPTLRQEGERKSAAREQKTIKLGRIRPNRSPGIGASQGHLLPSRLFLD